MTKIEWAEDVWNPIVGCSVVSPGCTNCYAMKDAWRKGFNPKTPQYHGLTRMTRGGPVWTGEMRLHEPAMTKPLKRRKPTTYFVNSMSDLFHEGVQDAWLDQVFAVMAICPQHRFLILTKRAERMREYLRGSGVCSRIAEWTSTFAPGRPLGAVVHHKYPVGPILQNGGPEFGYRYFLNPDRWPLPNIWLGVSAEDQTRADERIPDLLATPAAVRFVSVEPMLGPVDLTACPRDDALLGYAPGDDGDRHCVDWVIVGGESGPNARPMRLDHARDVVRQCQAAGVPVFVKQLGRQCVMNRSDAVQPELLDAGWDALEPGSTHGVVTFRHRKGGDQIEWPKDMRVQQFPEEIQ